MNTKKSTGYNVVTTFVITSQQAEIGKTTLALYLSEGLRKLDYTVLLNIRHQHAEFKWVKKSSPHFAFEHLYISSEQIELLKIRLDQLRENYRYMVVDLEEGNNQTLGSTLQAADYLIIPTDASLKSLKHVTELVAWIELRPLHANLPCFIVFNNVSLEMTALDLDESREIFNDNPNITCLKTILYADNNLKEAFCSEQDIWQNLEKPHPQMADLMAEIELLVA